MRLWITGAKGLLGSALAKLAPPSSIITDRSQVDITDLASLRFFVRSHPDITHIINAAAFSLVDLAETRREEAFQGNVIGPENLAVIASEIRAQLIHISTDYVFEGNFKNPLKETDPVLPQNYYGETKLEGEMRVQSIFPKTLIIRTSWIFGSGGKNFVAKFWQMLQEKKEISLTNDQWGRPTYVMDLAKTILEMLDQSGIYHFANLGIATKFSFGSLMQELAQFYKHLTLTKKIHAVPSSTFPALCKRPIYSAFDTTKIEAVLKKPIRTWQEALKEHICQIIS